MTSQRRKPGPEWSAALLVLISVASVEAQSLHGQAVCERPWGVSQTLQIGSVDGDVTLSWVRDVDIGPGGNVHVLQLWVHSIAVFSPTGRPVRTIGRAGSGPGEFEASPTRLGWLGDTLWVSDRFATHLLDQATTKEVGQVRFRTSWPREASHFVPGTPLADGTFLGNRILHPPVDDFYLSGRVPLLRFSRTGEIVDTITMVEPPPVITIDRAGKGPAILAHPLDAWRGESRLPVVPTIDGTAILMIGAVVGDQEDSTFELIKLSISGDTLFRRALPSARRPLSRQERARVRDGFAALYAGDFLDSNAPRPSPQQTERQRAAALETFSGPEFHPPVRQIVAGHDGSIWVLREAAPAEVDLWEIYDGEGALEGSVRIEVGKSDLLPWSPRLRVLRATRDELWATTMDDLGVTYLGRYEIDRRCQ